MLGRSILYVVGAWEQILTIFQRARWELEAQLTQQNVFPNPVTPAPTLWGHNTLHQRFGDTILGFYNRTRTKLDCGIIHELLYQSVLCWCVATVCTQGLGLDVVNYCFGNKIISCPFTPTHIFHRFSSHTTQHTFPSVLPTPLGTGTIWCTKTKKTHTHAPIAAGGRGALPGGHHRLAPPPLRQHPRGERTRQHGTSRRS